MVHPEFRAMSGQIEDFTRDAPPLTNASLSELRNRDLPFRRPLVDVVPVEQRLISDEAQDHHTSIYTINAKAGQNRPAILHMHGGGFVAGKASDALGMLQQLALDLDSVIVTVDYRLAPEARWKDSIEDNYAALKWLYSNAEALGVDARRIAVMGDSAGGGHAALLAIMARDRGEVPLVHQCLIYPMLDDRSGSTRQLPYHVGGLIWTADNNRFGWEAFLGQVPGTDNVPKQAVPARLDDFSDLPPAFIGVGTLDLFVDEGISYAQRMNQAGVTAELILVPGVFHGFDVIAPNAVVSQWFYRAMIQAFKRAFGITNDMMLD